MNSSDGNEGSRQVKTWKKSISGSGYKSKALNEVMLSLFQSQEESRSGGRKVSKRH